MKASLQSKLGGVGSLLFAVNTWWCWLVCSQHLVVLAIVQSQEYHSLPNTWWCWSSCSWGQKDLFIYLFLGVNGLVLAAEAEETLHRVREDVS